MLTLLTIFVMANIFELSQYISNERTVIDFLRTQQILKNNYYCCNQVCSKVMDVSLKDKEIFQCKICHHRYSIRTDSIFCKSKLELKVLLSILYFFSYGCLVSQIAFLSLKEKQVKFQSYSGTITSKTL